MPIEDGLAGDIVDFFPRGMIAWQCVGFDAPCEARAVPLT
jgi:hypothetical protein